MMYVIVDDLIGAKGKSFFLERWKNLCGDLSYCYKEFFVVSVSNDRMCWKSDGTGEGSL